MLVDVGFQQGRAEPPTPVVGVGHLGDDRQSRPAGAIPLLDPQGRPVVDRRHHRRGNPGRPTGQEATGLCRGQGIDFQPGGGERLGIFGLRLGRRDLIHGLADLGEPVEQDGVGGRRLGPGRDLRRERGSRARVDGSRASSRRRWACRAASRAAAHRAGSPSPASACCFSSVMSRDELIDSPRHGLPVMEPPADAAASRGEEPDDGRRQADREATPGLLHGCPRLGLGALQLGAAKALLHPAQVGGDLRDDGAGIAGPVARRGGQASAAKGDQVGLGPARRQPAPGSAQLGPARHVPDLGGFVAHIRGAAGEDLAEDGTQTEDVGRSSTSARSPRGLLGRHVGRRAEHRTGPEASASESLRSVRIAPPAAAAGRPDRRPRRPGSTPWPGPNPSPGPRRNSPP